MLNQKITQRLINSTIFLMIFSLIFAGFPVLVKASVEPSADSLIKVKGRPAVYYYASDGKRYVFPNEKIYKSWFTDFSEVTEVDMGTLAQIPLGGNVHYRPGVVMIKIVSVPTVYVVSANGVLRSVGSEAMAQFLYGENWNLLIDDLPDSFFTDYQIGPVIVSEDDYYPEEELEDTPTINHNRRIRVTNMVRWSNTYKCRAIPAVPAIPAHKSPTGIKIPAIPAIPARYCVHEYKQADTVAPTISDISVEVTNTTATISWTTDEESTSKVKYASQTLCGCGIKVVSDNSLVTSHELTLTNLTAGTTYYFIVKSTDASGNTGVSVEQTFTTTGATPADTTPPVISGIGVVASTTSALISWTTDENSSSKVKYADESLSTAAIIEMISNTNKVTTHKVELVNLTASTTYYFMVESTDASNNTATSTEQTFTTAQEPVVDNTPPVISSIAVVPSTTSAVISWTTDEAATSQVEYATESLETASTIETLSESALVTSHELELLSLTASTTYYFMIESKDASNNAATSTEQMFDTL